MDLTAISSALAGVKAATEILRGLASASRSAEINAKVIDLQNVILELQADLLTFQSQFADLAQENSELKEAAREQENWGRVESEYRLVEPASNVFVYESIDESSPRHWLCSNCFGTRRKSILQMYNRNQYGSYYQCPGCQAKLTVDPRR